jgi:hypothetical protein
MPMTTLGFSNKHGVIKAWNNNIAKLLLLRGTVLNKKFKSMICSPSQRMVKVARIGLP